MAQKSRWHRGVHLHITITRKSDYSMEKVNFPENTLLCVNQSYLTIKTSKDLLLWLFYNSTSCRVLEPSSGCFLLHSKGERGKDGQAPLYSKTGEFKGLWKTINYLVVRGSPEEVFFNYGCDCEKSKILFSHYRRRIPNSFSGTIFNRHRTMIESGEVKGNFSNIYFFLPAINDKSEEINQYLNKFQCLNFPYWHPTVSVKWLSWNKVWPLEAWLVWFGKNMMTDAVVKCLNYMNDISNSNIVRNADGLLSRREVEVPVDWIGDNKKCVLPQKFKVSYWLFF